MQPEEVKDDMISKRVVAEMLMQESSVQTTMGVLGITACFICAVVGKEYTVVAAGIAGAASIYFALKVSRAKKQMDYLKTKYKKQVPA